MVAANEEGADHAKALAVELAEMLAVLVRLWGRAVSRRRRFRRQRLSGLAAS